MDTQDAKERSAFVTLLRKVQADGGGKGTEVFQWTPMPFKLSEIFLTDIRYGILLPLKLTKGLHC